MRARPAARAPRSGGIGCRRRADTAPPRCRPRRRRQPLPHYRLLPCARYIARMDGPSPGLRRGRPQAVSPPCPPIGFSSRGNISMSAKKVTRQDLRDAAEKYKNWGKWGPNDEIGTLNYTSAEDIVAATRLVKKGKVISLALNFDHTGPQGAKSKYPAHGPYQSDPHHAAHRHRRLFRRARQARHPRRRRHGDDAAAMRHAVGRARPRVL